MHICAYSAGVDFEWDPAKAASNLKKHGVDFADAVLALDDDHCLTLEDTTAEEERRFVALGMDPFGVLLVVVFAPRSDATRIISARRATRTERRHYEAER